MMTNGLVMWLTHSIAFGVGFVLCAVVTGGSREL